MTDQTPPLRYVGLPSGLSDGSRPRLQFATPTGRLREVPLTREQLLKIIQSAARALEVMDRAERKGGRGDA